jgi:hypothetical protein
MTAQPILLLKNKEEYFAPISAVVEINQIPQRLAIKQWNLQVKES